MQFEIKDNKLKIDKTITKLDEFVIDILEQIEKYTDYVIISGYVSIFFGRARATEDIDIFIKQIPIISFNKLYDVLASKGYEFTIDNPKELYNDYLMQGISINIWKKGFPLLRMETKFAKKPSQKQVIKDKFTVMFGKHKFYFGSVESQIAYKRFIAKSDKDLSDARHLEIVFKNLDQQKIERYKNLFESEL